MKKIVRGNDFTLRIPVAKIVGGEQVAFPLPACTDIVVNIVNAYRRKTLPYSIDATADNVLLARVEGDTLTVGTYALEVRGKIFGNDWRSNEYEQFQIVDNNAKATTEFGDELIEGEDSVEMDTALVFLPPEADLSLLVDSVDDALDRTNKALELAEEKTNASVKAADNAASTATESAKYAKEQGDRAKAHADHPNIIGEDGYWYKWNEEKGEYEKTEHYSKGSVDFPYFDIDTANGDLNVIVSEGNEHRYELSEDGELLINAN